jgi:hypothetical protein
VKHTGCHVAVASHLNPALLMQNLVMVTKMAHQITFAIQHFLVKLARIGAIPFVLNLMSIHFRPYVLQQHAPKTWTLSNVY